MKPLSSEQESKAPINDCKEKWRDATTDHFVWSKPDKDLETFRQRYFLCDMYWKPTDDGKPGPIFFYLGNEADVGLYLNNTGLIWESAPAFGALIVFAEHRYYGKSMPYGKDVRKHMQYLSAEQAMGDYAELIMELKQELNCSSAPVIGFGGSYGGMLASWFRMKYPHLLDGAIAGSAPIWNFIGETPEFDSGAFAKGVTYDASEAGGSNPNCVPNLRKGWALIMELGQNVSGRMMLRENTKLCNGCPLGSVGDVVALRDWLSNAWDSMAMGNFPYPSSYILNGNGELPAFPVRVACEKLKDLLLEGKELLGALVDAASVFYNYSGEMMCVDFRDGANPESDEVADFWGYQYCTEMVMPFSRDGVNDMFWDEPWDLQATVEGCKKQWGVTPRPLWATTEWGGKDLRAASNIVFSNGLLDPWHGGGVLQDVSDTVVSVIIPEGAHHLDLMFSNPEDPQSVIAVRNTERNFIRQWIDESRLKTSATETKSANMLHVDKKDTDKGGETYATQATSVQQGATSVHERGHASSEYVRLGKEWVVKGGEAELAESL